MMPFFESPLNNLWTTLFQLCLSSTVLCYYWNPSPPLPHHFSLEGSNEADCSLEELINTGMSEMPISICGKVFYVIQKVKCCRLRKADLLLLFPMGGGGVGEVRAVSVRR
jgi:hypothetical protein